MRAPFCVVGWIAAAIIAVEIVAGVPCHPERQGAQIGDPPNVSPRRAFHDLDGARPGADFRPPDARVVPQSAPRRHRRTGGAGACTTIEPYHVA
jgi:hypothetical protein